MDEMTAWLVSITAAVVPTVVYVLILWWLDRYEKEPKRLLLSAFLWGAVPGILLSVFVEVWLQAPLGGFGAETVELMTGSVLAPVVEEIVKGVALLAIFLLFRREFDNVLDGIIYGATVGFGFAMTENVFYFINSLGEMGVEGLALTVFLRTVVYGLNHAMFTSVFGMALGYVRMSKAGPLRWLAPPLGLLAAMALHGIHNLFASLASITCFSLLVTLISDWGGVLVIFVVMVLSWRQEKRWIAKNLQPEVASGLLTAEQYDVFGSYRKRLAAEWRTWSQQGRREAQKLGKLSQLATELAFKVEQGDSRTAEKLRQQIARVRDLPYPLTSPPPDPALQDEPQN